MSVKAKISPEQLKRRQAFERLKRSLRAPSHGPLPATGPTAGESPEPELVPDPTDSLPPPPAPPAPPAPTTPSPPPPTASPANHGTAFSNREPMTCEVCRESTTKWLSYKPAAKTCVCWDCGLERQAKLMGGPEA